jgi:hypothetical protein
VEHVLAVRVVDGEADPAERGEQAVARVALLRVAIAAGELGDDLVQGRAGDGLHREVRGAVIALADVVDRDDRGVLELALHARLAEEPRAQALVARRLGAQLLACDAAADAMVDLRADDAHAAAAELAVGRVALRLAGQAERCHRARDRWGRDRRAVLEGRGVIDLAGHRMSIGDGRRARKRRNRQTRTSAAAGCAPASMLRARVGTSTGGCGGGRV